MQNNNLKETLLKEKAELEKIKNPTDEQKRVLDLINERLELEGLADLEIIKIHPALDFLDKAYTTVWLTVEEDGELKDKPFIITSDKEKLLIDELPKGLKLKFFPCSSESIENRWNKKHIEFYLNVSKNVDIKELFLRIKNLYKKHIELPDDRYYTFKAIWDIGTYFFPIFKTGFPYLFLIAPKRSGKTKFLTLTKLLCFNGVLTGSITEASIFRPTQFFRNTLCIDELEHISSREASNLRDLLKMGYKDGLIIRRYEERQGRLILKEFNLFSPKVMASTQGYEEILEDRGFAIIMERSNRLEILNSFVDDEDPEIIEIRNELYILLMNYWKEVKEKYNSLKVFYGCKSVECVECVGSEESVECVEPLISINTSNTINTKNHIHGRWLELSLPILTISSVIGKDVNDEMISFIEDIIKEKEATDIVQSRDMAFLTSLVSFIQYKDQNNFYSISEIKKHFMEIQGEEIWISNDWIGRALRRLKVVLEQKITKQREVRLSFNLVIEKAKKYGLDAEKIQKEYLTSSPEKQESLEMV